MGSTCVHSVTGIFSSDSPLKDDVEHEYWTWNKRAGGNRKRLLSLWLVYWVHMELDAVRGWWSILVIPQWHCLPNFFRISVFLYPSGFSSWLCCCRVAILLLNPRFTPWSRQIRWGIIILCIPIKRMLLFPIMFDVLLLFLRCSTASPNSSHRTVCTSGGGGSSGSW